MSQSGFNSGLGTRRAVDVRLSPPPRRSSNRARRQDLEMRLAAVQKDYAELHTEIFEAAEVHRRLCAPRLVRCGDFEIASEIFAVRHLPGDFFTIKKTNRAVILALGDICGKGLAAGMWTPPLSSARVNHGNRTSVRRRPSPNQSRLIWQPETDRAGAHRRSTAVQVGLCKEKAEIRGRRSPARGQL